MSYDTWEIWLLIGGLGLGTFLIRFSFLGLIGGRRMPEWVLRHLRYAPVAVLPGLVAPLVIWPEATGGAPDLPRAAAALATLAVGLWTRSTIWSILAGAGTLFGLIALGV
ncbi:hypothetical protein AIOL_003533 [Candidatus Rhodobacter oscarellae]|uniref:Transmembrane protein n=1 Tax=Candidatus Rhodobacter oscarellae TaxID=1675527 RepID=A0A0J9E769_9RHOB|nr:AzlD domain-containing protein [Candidatus Rhodobacter lobularis]KMW58556.1 hypothetical protein AIOL_003533 [Candidatus Rhodobacter lobularis]